MTDPVLTARAALGVAARKGRGGKADPEAIATARRELNAAKLERYVREVVAAAPPLTAEQRARIAAILTGGADK